MTTRVAKWWNPVRLLLGGGGLFLAVGTWVVMSAAPLESAPPVQAPVATQPATVSPVYKAVYNGWKWWHVYCFRCHGTDALATTLAPDLIDPSRRLTRAAFLKTVRDGVPDKGMQAWDKLLGAEQVGDLFTYVRARSQKILPPGRPDEVGPNGGAWVPPAGWTAR
jgi:mono/diheme cytochrome c family protein